jgi:hypothetical protein
MQLLPSFLRIRAAGLAFGEPHCEVDRLGDFAGFGMNQRGHASDAELPERLIAVAPRPNVEGVALCLNLLRNVQCANALVLQMARTCRIPCLLLNRDLQPQRVNLIVQLTYILFDNMFYCMRNNNNCCTKYNYANNRIEFILITVHFDAPDKTESLKTVSIYRGGIGFYTRGLHIRLRLLLMRFTAIGTKSDISLILLIEPAGVTCRLCCARIWPVHRTDKHGRKDPLDQQHQSAPCIKTILPRPRGRAFADPALCGTEPDLPIRRCCAGDRRVISSRTSAMRSDPPTAAEFDRLSAQAVQIALKNKATERRCPFGGKDHGRREHWLTIYRRWRTEKIRTEQ